MSRYDGYYPSYTYPTYTTSSSTMFTPTFYTNTFVPQAVDISFNPNPVVPDVPKTELDWLREMNDAVCDLARL